MDCKRITLWILAVFALASCGSSRIGNGNGGGNGKLQVKLTDAPAPFEAVNVTVSAVAVHYRGETDGSGSARWVTVATNPGTFNLLALQNGVTADLGERSIPAGKYDQIRLELASAEAVTGGSVTPLAIPAGVQGGVCLDYDFAVAEDEEYAVVLDFDADQSVRMNSDGHYMMMPVLSVMHFTHMQAGNEHAEMVGNMGGNAMGCSKTMSTMSSDLGDIQGSNQSRSMHK